MTLPTLDRAGATGRLAQIAQLKETYVPKTGQTGQTGQSTENASKIGTSPGQKLTSRHPKLASAYQKRASGTVQQPNPAAQEVRTRIDSAYPRPNGVSQL
ncbi:MAG: hypothetical protein K0S81_2299 [Rhodospirillales bacterium]|jgi:hypothetical protein|nr:hypothetical protein [Geminicoccaceae bacterium]MDF2765305.1 hypothetical protein [Rhodospirillales bacterium]